MEQVVPFFSVVPATLTHMLEGSSVINRCLPDVSDGHLMHMYLEATFRVAGQMDRYSMVPASYPWRFVLLQSQSEEIRKLTLKTAAKEWARVLQVEAKWPNRLGAMAPLTLWHSYRELMLVGSSAQHRTCLLQRAGAIGAPLVLLYRFDAAMSTTASLSTW